MSDFQLEEMKSKSICQIFQIDYGQIESIASGILVSFSKNDLKYCLLTAAHVAKEKNLVIESSMSHSANPEYNKLEEELFLGYGERDWALYILPDFFAEDLLRAGKKFYNYNFSSYSSPFTFCGFPSSKNKSSHTVVKCRPYSHTGDEVKRSVYKKIGVNQTDYIAVSFHRKDVENVKTKERMVFPEPQGMSGGPIFDQKGMLAGIVTNYEPKLNVLYGIRIEAILEDFLQLRKARLKERKYRQKDFATYGILSSKQSC